MSTIKNKTIRLIACGQHLVSRLWLGAILAGIFCLPHTTAADFTNVITLVTTGSNAYRSASWGDYDGDNDLDLFITGDSGAQDRLFRNDGNDQFTEMFAVSGNYGEVHWADYDNDGDLDVYVARYNGLNVVYPNVGGVIQSSSVSVHSFVGSAPTTGAAFDDYDNDGDLDIYITQMNANDYLLANDGSGVFNDLSSLLPARDGSTQDVNWVDYDDDGDRDIYIAVWGTNRFFRNDNDGASFVDVSASVGGTHGGLSRSALWGDFNNDNHLDLYIPINNATNVFNLNDGDGTFTNHSASYGVTSGGFGGGVADYDNDGDLDVYVAGVNRLLQLDSAQETFSDVAGTEQITIGANNQGVSWGDYDGDGDMDLVLPANGGAKIFRNNNTGTNWLTVRLQGVDSNSLGIGATVVARTGTLRQRRLVDGGSGANSSASIPVEFGFGSGVGTVDSLIIEWPGAAMQILTNITTDQALTLAQTYNTNPTISDIADLSIDEDTATNALAFTVGDAETVATALTLSATSSDETLVLGSGIAFGGSGASRTVTVNPIADQTGTATITVTVTDADGGSASDDFALTVNPVNDAPAIDDSGSMALSPVNEDDGDPPGDTVAQIIASAGGDRVTDLDAGAVEGLAVTAVDDANGTWAYSTDSGTTWTPFGSPSETVARLLDANAKIRFVPDADYAGSVNNGLTFRAWDTTSGANGGTADATSNGGTTAFSSSTEVAAVSIAPVNDKPTIAPIANINIGDSAGPQQVTVSTTPGGGGDEASQTVTISATSSNTAFVTIDGTTPTRIDYTPVAAGTATITVTADDGQAQNNTATTTFTITVDSVNDPPVAVDDAITIAEDAATTAIDARANDSDPESPVAALTITQVTGAAFGSAAPSADNTQVEYTPDPDANGTETLTYTLSDGELTDTGTITVTVTPVNDAPTADAATDTTIAGVALTLTLGGDDIDDAPAALTYAIVAQPASGTLDASNAPTIVYTPDPGFIGDDQFTFTVSDGEPLTSAVATVDITVLAGNAQLVSTYASGFIQPRGLAVSGNGDLYVTDIGHFAAYKVDTLEVVNTFAGQPGLQQTSGQGYTDGAAATTAALGEPVSAAFTAAGELLIADALGAAVHRVDAGGNIHALAGLFTAGFNGDGQPATQTSLNQPTAAVEDGAGNLYIADRANKRVRKIDLSGTVSTWIGDGQELISPVDLFVDKDDNLYISDTGKHQVFKKGPHPSNPLTVVAGSGLPGFAGDDGPAALARLDQPHGIWVDATGDLYIADRNNHRIRKVAAATGTITTVVGSDAGYSGDGGLASLAQLDSPTDIAIDFRGYLYIADTGNGAVRQVSGFGPINHPPILAPLADATVDEGQTLDVALSASDPDTTALTLSLDAPPPFASLSYSGTSGTLHLAPGTADAGVYTVTVTATDILDPSLAHSESFTLTVNNVNQAPIITGAPLDDVSLAEGTALDVAVSASDPDGTTPALSATSMPSFATFTDHGDGTATLHLAPDFSDDGTYAGLTIIAADGTDTATDAIDITVTTAQPQLSLAHVQSLSGGTAPVALSLNQAELLAAAKLKIAFDPAKLAVDPADVHLTDLTSGFALTVNVGSGTLGIGLAGDTPLPLGSSGALVEVGFEVLSTDPADLLALDLVDNEAELLYAEGQGGHTSVDPSLVDGSLDVEAGTPGDVNLSTALDLEDVVLILQIVADLYSATPFETVLADYDQDGDADVGDALGALGALSPAAKAAFSSDDPVSLRLPAIETPSAGPISAPIYLGDGQAVYAIDLLLGYDALSLDLIDVLFADGDALVVTNAQTPGQVRLVGISMRGFAGDLEGTLASLTFDAQTSGPQELRLRRAQLLNREGEELSILYQGRLLGGLVRPDTFTLYPNYPNPFNPETTVRYDLAQQGPVRVAVYNLAGQEVEVLHEGVQRAGYRELVWRAEGYAPGVYLLAVETESARQVVKMLLLK